MSSLIRFISCICVTILLAGLGVSCKEDKKPVGLLSQAEMINVLTDIYIAEQKVQQIGVSADSVKIVFEKLKDKIFEKRGTSDSLFKISFDYYTERPKELEEIYTVMIDSVSLKEQQLEASTKK